MPGAVSSIVFWKREFKFPWREAGPPNQHNDKVDSNQYVANKEVSLFIRGEITRWEAAVERSGNILKRFKNFRLKATARIWLRLPYLCRLRSTAGASTLDQSSEGRVNPGEFLSQILCWSVYSINLYQVVLYND